MRLEAKGHQGSVRPVQRDDRKTSVDRPNRGQDKYEDSPLQDSVVWKGGRYTKLESDGASPLI